MKTALLIIDIQNDYFEGGLMPLVNADGAAANAKLLLDKFRAEHLPVVHVQHVATMPNAPFFVAYTAGVAIHEPLTPRVNEKLVIKHYPNAFRETDLLYHLQMEGITNLVICGMMTQHCIDTSTRAARDLGFDIVLIGDACATKDLELNGQTVAAEQVQLAFLAALNFGFATVKTTEQYLSGN